MNRALVISAVLFSLFVVLAAACSDGDKGETPPSGGGETQSPAETAVPTAPAVPTVLGIGQRVEVPGYPDIVVEGFRRSSDEADVAGETMSYRLGPGEEFLIMDLEVINDTDGPYIIDRVADFSLLSQGEVVTEGLAMLVALDGGLTDGELEAGAEVRGLVVWLSSGGYDDLALLYSPVALDSEGGDQLTFIIPLERE